MQTWIIWVIIAAVLGTIEILTTTLAFGLVALAAIVAAVAGAAGGDAAIQFGAFVLASALGLGVARPFALRHIRQPPLLRLVPHRHNPCGRCNSRYIYTGRRSTFHRKPELPCGSR